jgi:hypothetical protein
MRWSTTRRGWNSANQEDDLEEALASKSVRRQSRDPFRAGSL